MQALVYVDAVMNTDLQQPFRPISIANSAIPSRKHRYLENSRGSCGHDPM
jgi:hypothetical protein